jgi:hypothetical protein
MYMLLTGTAISMSLFSLALFTLNPNWLAYATLAMALILTTVSQWKRARGFLRRTKA